MPKNRNAWILIGIVIVVALFMRLYQLDGDLSGFHPMRNYRAAIGIRYFYLTQHAVDTPLWLVQAVSAQYPAPGGVLEPPLVEMTGAWIYRLLNGEQVAVLRALSSIFYVVGAFFVCLTAYRLYQSTTMAVFTLAFMALIPFGVVASQTLQVDPFMLMLLCIVLYLLILYRDSGSLRTLGLAAILTGFVLFVKPLGVYFIFVTYAAVAYLRGNLISWRTIVFGVIGTVPMLLYYGSGLLFSSDLQENAAAQFVPALLLTQGYYAGQFAMIDRVVGIVPFVAAIFGLLLINRRSQSTILLALWLSWVLFIVTFTYLTSTHSYYHFQLIPIVALSLAPLAEKVITPISQRLTINSSRIIVAGLVIVIAAGVSAYTNWWRQFLNIYEQDDPSLNTVYEEIGELVEHSSNVLYLTESYGTPLEYYALIDGHGYATSLAANFSQITGLQALDTAEELGSRVADTTPEYFIVTQMIDYTNFQPELRAWLSDFPIVAETPQYIIYDLQPE